MVHVDETAAKALAALGHDVRLHIFRLLVKSGDTGLNVGDIGYHLGVPPSTLAHHLSMLVDAQLVEQQRNGRQIINRANYQNITALVSFLTDECCHGVDIVHVSNNDESKTHPQDLSAQGAQE